MYAVDQLVADPVALAELAESLDTLDPSGIRCAKIKLTSKCNLRCQMCHYWTTTREETLDTDAWRRVLTQLHAAGCRKVHFSGGEVFLRRDFLDLVEHAGGLGMKVNMTTNGTLLTREKVRRLVRARPNSVSLSLDGPTAQIHDGIRGIPGSFARTCRTIRALQTLGDRYGARPRVRLNFVMMRANYRRAADMVRLAAALQAVELHPMPVDEKGEARRRLTRSQIERYNREIAPQVLELRRSLGFATHPALVHPYGTTAAEVRHARDGLYARGFYARHACLAPWLHLFIAWDGETYLCCMTTRRMESLGNVRHASVGEVFGGARYREVRRAFQAGRHLPSCARCDMFLDENATLHAALRERDK